MKLMITSLFVLPLLVSCGGGGNDGIGVVAPQRGDDLEEHLMRFQDPDLNLEGTLIPQDIEAIARGIPGFNIQEVNEINSSTDCRFRIYSSQGAFIDTDNSIRKVYFSAGGRLSGGFASGGGGAGSNSEGWGWANELRDENGKPLLRGPAVLTPVEYGDKIVANVSTFGVVAMVERIVQYTTCSDAP